MFCKSPKIFRSRCKNYRKSKFFFKKIPQSLDLDSPNAVFTPLGESFFPKTKTILVKVLRRLKNHNFSQKKLLNLFPWTPKLRFRKPYSKLFVKRHKISPQMTKFVPSRHKNYKKINIFRNVFPQKRPLDT